MYDNVATLKKESGRTYDEYANEIITYTERVVAVQPRSVYNAEFYNAAQIGLHPSITLFISNRADYEGETLVEFEGKTYNVIRADWNAQRDGISLVMEERVNNG